LFKMLRSELSGQSVVGAYVGFRQYEDLYSALFFAAFWSPNRLPISLTMPHKQTGPPSKRQHRDPASPASKTTPENHGVISVILCKAVCYSVIQCVAVCCSVLQCVAVCCSVLQCARQCQRGCTTASCRISKTFI